MSSTALEHGETLQKQFKRVVVSGGPLQGARYLDVGWSDLKKAARSYRSDPRFNQFAKRVLSERALGEKNDATLKSLPAASTWRSYIVDSCKTAMGRMINKVKMRFGVMLLLILFAIIILSRPLFYTVLAKSLALGLRVFLRRTIGFIVMLIDALLDEAASSLESALLTPPTVQEQNPMSAGHFEMSAPPRSIHEFILQGMLTLLGVLIGHRLPRAGRVDRNAPPTRLRIV